MRIIAGEHRGRQLLAPENENTRPITDRVKQSVFDILAPVIEDADVYDCFSGTGSMGLECLSRGAGHVTFFESDRSAVKLLKANIDTLRVASRATVVSGDLFEWFSRKAGEPVDLIFLDPPYRYLTEMKIELQRLAAGVAESGALVVFRHAAQDKLALPPLEVVDQREYGGMAVEFLRKPTH
jgi:16S rRNA (guanine966-N2)-methyltransferase